MRTALASLSLSRLGSPNRAEKLDGGDRRQVGINEVVIVGVVAVGGIGVVVTEPAAEQVDVCLRQGIAVVDGQVIERQVADQEPAPVLDQHRRENDRGNQAGVFLVFDIAECLCDAVVESDPRVFEGVAAVISGPGEERVGEDVAEGDLPGDGCQIVGRGQSAGRARPARRFPRRGRRRNARRRAFPPRRL